MTLMLARRTVNGMAVYGNDQSEDSYKQALALVDKYPDMKLIMAPTSVGIVAAAKHCKTRIFATIKTPSTPPNKGRTASNLLKV